MKKYTKSIITLLLLVIGFSIPVIASDACKSSCEKSCCSTDCSTKTGSCAK